ncbi:MAG: aminotransferase class I/II-fold pyridoxal phosphate-dependent enzyme [Solirubrobacteraceae bacterium]|nr:aminotransferase class I/II-fold pyridoxal phosphate-dependent enzyme [Solirubrobacteraceae bacterium]
MVDLRSDTATRPTPQMRAAMAAAEVGDEQRFEDPQVNALCERVAELLGQEAAVFLPSGTMCNAIAFRLHLDRPGSEAILHRTAHPILYEGGQPAAYSAGMVCPIDSPDGTFTGDDVRAAVHDPANRYAPLSRLVNVEQTANEPGGRIWPLERIDDVLAAAREHDLRTHLDGARLLNAVVATGVPADRWAGGFDTAWLDFSKGLGAPMGACLAGSKEFIERAWRLKQMTGGALRQAGIVAAGALHALDRHVDRLADDHTRATTLAEGLAQLPGITIDPSIVETNIVRFDVADPPAFCAELREHGVLMAPLNATTVRAVTHLDVDDDGIDTALVALSRIAAA